MSRTPGPWRRGNNYSEVVSDNQVEGASKMYLEEARKFYGGYLIAESICNKEDANLITSAPELLEACIKAHAALEAITEFCGQNLAVYGWHLNGDPEPFDNFIEENIDGDELELLKRAISKAKGEKINE